MVATRPVAEVRHATAALLAARVEGLDTTTALAVLQQARAWHAQAIYDLHQHLQRHPDALVSGKAAGPLSLVRLVHALIGAGHTGLVAPRCVRCGRGRPDLHATRDEGRICVPCYRQDTMVDCARCGRRTRACHRRDEGVICRSCRDAEPATRGTCPGCGWQRPLRRRRDGSHCCDNCAPHPQHTCIDCHTTAIATAITAQGPVCPRCYRKRSARPCGQCGRIRPIIRKATDEHPDLCISCRPRTTGTCSRCGRHTYVNRSDRGHGDPICQACRPKIQRECAMCGQISHAQAFWPLGPVCHSCYGKAKNNPARCGSCGHHRVLVAAHPDHGRICGRCAGTSRDYICTQCGHGGRPYSNGMCDRCVLTHRLDELFGHATHAQLAPLVTAMKQAQRVDMTLLWLKTSPTARLLTQLTAEDAAISHQLLDSMPQNQTLRSLRHLLVRTGVLPARNEYLDRIGPWLAETLATAPAAHAMIVRPYCRWFLLHRARRRAAARGITPAASYHLRSHIRAVLALLAWLQQQGTDLATATQSDIDTWLAGGAPSQRYRTRQFLTWAGQRGLAGDLSTPPDRPGRTSIRPLDDDSLFEQLTRCLHDNNIPLDVRVAAALVLLYGITPARLVRITADHLTQDGHDTWLTAGRKPIHLPPPLAKLITTLADSPNDLSNVPAAGTHQPRLLFPGRATSAPMRAAALRNRLARYAIVSGPGRHTALLALADDLPAPVVADLLGVKHETAMRWASHTSRDWTPYLAARDEDHHPPLDSQNSTDGQAPAMTCS